MLEGESLNSTTNIYVTLSLVLSRAKEQAKGLRRFAAGFSPAPAPVPFAGQVFHSTSSLKLSVIISGFGFHASACSRVETPLSTTAVGHPTP